MYESFYGLREKPFNLSPDPDYFYMSPGHENVLTHLEYAIQESKGFVVVTGEVGSGKTTLINYLLRKIPQNTHMGIINNTLVQFQELLRMICLEFELEIDNAEKAVLLTRLYSYLLDKYSKRERVILIIDEAQNLPEKTLEEIRLLSNLEAEKHHLLQMILVGQPQLREKLQRKSLEQFVQRITVYCHLDALDNVQTNYYIRHRLKVAGAQNLDIFDKNAIEAIVEYSGGIPRLINMLCDAALVYGYADDIKTIGRDLIDTVDQARPPGKRRDKQGSLPEEKIYEASTSESLTLLRQEFESRIKSLEEKYATQEDRILNLTKELKSLQGYRDARDKMLIQLLKMVKNNLDRQADIMAARLQEQGAELIAVVSRKKSKKKSRLILLRPTKSKESEPVNPE
jgi:general secretion pathway protein A